MKIFSLEGILLIAIVIIINVSLYQIDVLNSKGVSGSDLNGIGVCMLLLTVISLIGIFK